MIQGYEALLYIHLTQSTSIAHTIILKRITPELLWQISVLLTVRSPPIISLICQMIKLASK